MFVVVKFRAVMDSDADPLRSGCRWRSDRTRLHFPIVPLHHLLMLLKPFLKAHRRLSEGLDG